MALPPRVSFTNLKNYINFLTFVKLVRHIRAFVVYLETDIENGDAVVELRNSR